MAFCPTYTILGVELEEEEIEQIVLNGMSSGVEGFTYFHQCADRFDEHDDEVQDYLSDYVYELTGGTQSSFAFFAPEAEDVTQLKTRLVCAYVELKAEELINDSNQLKKGRKITKRMKNAKTALTAS